MSPSSRSSFWINYVNKYGKPKVDIVITGLSWADACVLEIKLIDRYKRRCEGGCLVNLTRGGEGSLGTIVSEETRNKRKGKRHTDETRRKISETKMGISNPWRIGRKLSEAQKNKISNSHKGKTHSLETRLKISLTKISKGYSYPAWNKGIPQSEETKQKIRANRLMKNNL